MKNSLVPNWGLIEYASEKEDIYYVNKEAITGKVIYGREEVANKKINEFLNWLGGYMATYINGLEYVNLPINPGEIIMFTDGIVDIVVGNNVESLGIAVCIGEINEMMYSSEIEYMVDKKNKIDEWNKVNTIVRKILQDKYTGNVHRKINKYESVLL